MPKIKILPENLSNKIAAGEVVERPASVVKELIENALDAEATRIIIEVEKGGQSLIQVSDNGVGMRHADALLAIERHATSKISTDDDLFAIRTLGFRGEALPSIAAVSRFKLITCHHTADTGTEISIDGGKIKSIAEIGAPEGTLISVKQLFFNTPARRKFLKTIGTEMSHIADIVAKIALGHPEVQFRLIHNDKVVKSWPLVSQHLDRVVDILGKDCAQDLHAIEIARNGVCISGWICSPRMTRRTSRGLYVFVNGRFVRDRSIQHGVFQGYAQRLVKGQFPIAAVFIKVPFDQVDVNVHPTKNEVRFVHPHQVHEAVKGAIAQTLYEIDRLNWRPEDRPQGPEAQGTPRVSESHSAFKPSNRHALSSGPTRFSYPEFSDGRSETGDPQPVAIDQQPARDELSRVESGGPGQQAVLWEDSGFSALRVVGQLHNLYIVCESDHGLVLIDQHAAHERIFFEQLKQRSREPRSAAQRLLVPETLELSFREAEILGQMLPDLKSLGLEIEPFGGNTFVVKAVPALLSGQDPKPMIYEMVEKTAAEGYSAGLENTLDQCRMVMACHGAIRASQQLGASQMKRLLDQLDECNNPSRCPHGRPTWIRWDLATLEKLFKRAP
ncbi:MAG: DNA mismatch repair endonuclease MutL [Desulfobacterales bacterium]|jgi:DNA mismatch repair protein MutL